MAITQAQYDAYLQQAIDDFAARKGADAIAFADQNVHFMSWDEIWEWLRFLKSQIPGVSRTRLAATRKGV